MFAEAGPAGLKGRNISAQGNALNRFGPRPSTQSIRSESISLRRISASSCRNRTPYGNRMAQRPVFGARLHRMCCQKA